ncbi:hypothetical protein EIP86_008266 [Pleurotus ostreatoroseus]|nr:hypothetical protein EIP86_008266 [Pleurotus ostreatoroseus]
MFKPLTLVSLLSLAIPAFTRSCVTFDASFNLLVFGLDGKDWNAGTQDAWAGGKATDITASGRPPFDGANTTCYLAQFFNAVYILNGDATNPSDIHIYDATAKSWTTQKVDTGNFDPSSFNAILDHDTNVFYALSHDELYFVDFGKLTSANATALSWVDVGKAPYPDNYDPVMALAQNHVHFLDVPGNSPGEADIFVIHYSFFQPDPQSYPLPDGSAFPATHGQTASFFQESGVQQEFAFIPDDGSQTYVINVETNTTQALAGPTTKDANALYAASITALVQLDSTGAIQFLPYKEGDTTTNSQAKWTSVAAVSAVAPPGSSSSASATSGASNSSSASAGSSVSVTKSGASSGSQTSTSGSASSSQTGTSSQTSDAFAIAKGTFGLGMVTAGVLALSGFFL